MLKRRVYIGIVLLVIAGYRLYAYMDDRYMKPSRCEQGVEIKAAKRLSSESEQPFKWQGKPISSRSPSLAKYYMPSVTRFPDVRACLEDTEKDSVDPNLARFDWNKIHTNEDADVCMFRVFDSLGDVPASVGWLQSQGFEVKVEGDDRRGYNVRARHYPDICGVRFVQHPEDQWITVLAYALLLPGPAGYNYLSLTSFFNGSGEIQDTQTLLITK